MGRIVDLCSEIAEWAEEGTEGLVLPPDAWERLRGDWTDEDIEDALTLVQESLLHSELVETADSLSARLVELLGPYGEAAGFLQVQSGQAVLGLDVVGQLVRRVARLEEVLESYREGSPPDRTGFDALQRRLRDHGIEEEMTAPRDEESELQPAAGNGEDDEEDDR
jgi:uncharacterized protein with von Willebrand factor type A (vWA) domain